MIRYVIRRNMNKHEQTWTNMFHWNVIKATAQSYLGFTMFHFNRSHQPWSPQKSQTYFKNPHENHEIRGCLAAVFLGQGLHLPLSKLRNQLKLSSFHGRRLLRSLATKEGVPFSQSLKASVLRGNRYQSAWWICPKLLIYLGTQTTLSVLTQITSKKSMHSGTHFLNVLLPQNIAIRLGRNADMKTMAATARVKKAFPPTWKQKKPMSKCPPVSTVCCWVDITWHHLIFLGG